MTTLDPLKEVLFQGWAKAHGITNHDDPSNGFDHRGVFDRTNGMIHPPGHINQMAKEHNAAMDAQEGGDTTIPDPYAAQAEMHGNELKAKTDQAKIQSQFSLEDLKHKHKMELEQMKLQFKAQETEKKAAMDAQKADQDRQAQQQQAQSDRQSQLEQLMTQRQFNVEDKAKDQQFEAANRQQDRQAAVQDKHMDRQFAQQDQAHDQQADLHGQVLREQLARSQPQQSPSPSGGLQQALMGRQVG